MNPFSLVLIFIVSLIMLKKNTVKDKYISLITVTISLELFIGNGYFFKIGDFELLYFQFLLFLVGLLSIFMLFKIKINNNALTYGFFLALILTINVGVLILMPLKKQIITYGMTWTNFYNGWLGQARFTNQTIINYLLIILIVIIGIVCVSIFEEKYIDVMTLKIKKIAIVMLNLDILEWSLKNIFHNDMFIRFSDFFFGRGEGTVDVMIQRGGLFSLQGFMKEPAHLGGALFNLGLIFLLSKLNKSTKGKMIFLISTILVMSGSFRGALNAIILIVLFFYLNYEAKKVSLIIGLSIATIIPIIQMTQLFQYYYFRLTKAISTLFVNGNYSLLGSEFRIMTVIETYKICMNRPFLGTGLGTTYAYGFLPTIIATTGFLGLISWLLFMFKGIGKVRINKVSILIVIILLIIWNLQGQMEPSYSLITIFICLQIRFLNNKDKIRGL